MDLAKIFSLLYLAVIKTNDGAGVLVARLLSAALPVVAFTALSPLTLPHSTLALAAEAKKSWHQNSSVFLKSDRESGDHLGA